MELLLRHDVEKLGKRGDIVTVTRGYGRNYLLPNGLATTVSDANVRQLEREHKKYVAKEMARREELSALAEKLNAHSVTIEARANEEGHLFGSVSYELILEAFTADGFQLDPKQVELENPEKMPLKEVGIYSLKIDLHPEISAFSKVWVVEASTEEE